MRSGKMRLLFWSGAVLLLALLVGACAAEEAAPTPTATATEVATVAAGETVVAEVTATTVAEETVAAVSVGKYGGTLGLAAPVDPSASTLFDPIWSGGATSTFWSGPLHCQLIRYGPTKDLQRTVNGDIAKSWEVTDGGTTYTFHLRDDIIYHDGNRVTAQDVVASIGPKWGVAGFTRPIGRSPYLPLQNVVDTVSAPDDYTVVVTLKHPSNSFMDNAALAYNNKIGLKKYLDDPDKAKGGVGQQQNPTWPGCGPFKFVRYEKANVMEMTRYDKYHELDEGGNRLPYLDGQIIYVIRDDSTMFAAFKTGKVQLTQAAFHALRPEQAEEVEKNMKGKAHVVWEDALGNFAVNFYHNKKPWDNRNVRYAFHLAVDRALLSDTVWGSGRYQLASPLPRVPGFTRFGDDLKDEPGYRYPKTADIAEANRLLDQEGFPKGKDGIRFTVPYMGVTAGRALYVDIAVVLKDMYKKALGVEIKLAVTDAASATEVATGLPDLRAGHQVSRGQGPLGNADYYIDGGSYLCNDPVKMQLLDKADSTLDPAAFKLAVRELEQYLMDNVLCMAVFAWNDYPTAMWNYVKGYTPAIGPYNEMQRSRVWFDK